MIIPEDYAQVNVKYTGDSLPFGAEWTMGVSINAYSGDPLTLGEDFATAIANSDLQSLSDNDCDITQVSVKYGPNDTGPSADFGAAISCNGGLGGESPAAAALVKKNTGHGGRRGRGRFYIPGVPGSAFGIGGLCSPAYQAAADVILQDFLNELEALGVGAVVLHGPEHASESPYLITSLTFQPRIATQRRRNRP